MSQPLPERRDLRQLRRQAKELRDSARAGDTAALGRIASSVAPRDPAAVTLAIAQLAIARERGFPSWPKLKAAVDARAGGRSQHVSAFLTASVAGRTREAARLPAGDPQIGHASVFAAAALGEAGLVGEFIAIDPTLAQGLDDDRGWPPLLYACYSHWHRIDPARAGGLTAVASLLLDAGADPATTNGRRAGHGRRSALDGSVAVNNPAITRLLLDRGAPADDGDALYQAATYPDCACLELLLGHGAPVASNWAVDAAAGARNTSGLRLLLDAAARAEPGEVAALTTRALSPAADSGLAEAVEALLGAGASHQEVWLAGKPPSGEVAEVLREYGVQPDSEPGPGWGGQRPQPDSGPPAPDLMREIAEQLTEAYHSVDMELLASLLDPAVQWGSSGPDGCHTREQVLAWYAAAADGIRVSVTSAEVTGDTIVLTVALTRPADDTRPLPPQPVRQAFKVSGGAITQITGLPLSSPDTSWLPKLAEMLRVRRDAPLRRFW
jgi:hypothetical protein